MAIQTVIGAFDDRQSAERAVEKLVQAGFDRNDVHIEAAGAVSQGMTDATSTTASSDTTQRHEDQGVMASISHFFSSLFGDDGDNRRHVGRYAEAVRRGNVIVVVDATSEQQADQAASLLHECGAVDVDERAQDWRAQGWDESATSPPIGTPLDLLGRSAATRAAAGTTTRDDGASLRGENKLDVVQEEFEVGKRDVQRGGVRVIQRVSEQPVHELVRLREERAIVDRHPADREATSADLSNFREGSIEVRETVEEPVVQKTARVVEEVRVGKEVREREETVEGTVRRKDVEVERLPGEGMTRTDIERERAVAADNDPGTGDVGTTPRDRDSLVDRDRDALTGSDRGSIGNSGDKPRRNQ